MEEFYDDVFYKELSNHFPYQIDEPLRFEDVSAATKPLVEQYYELFNCGNYQDAAKLIEQNPDLAKCIVTAATLNYICDTNISIQKFLMDEWVPKFWEYWREHMDTKIFISETEPEPMEGAIWFQPVSEEELANM